MTSSERLQSTSTAKLIRRNSWLLFVGSLLLYAVSLGHQFVLDDALVLTDNRFVANAEFWGLLSQDTFAGFFQHDNTSQLISGGRYRPLTLILFSLIWMLSQSPWVFHFLNVLAFAITVVVIYRLILSTSIDHLNYSEQHPLAFITALLFAVHPIHTEVVNNIKGLDDILSLLLALLAWLVLLKPLNESTVRRFLILFSLMFLALMAKESAIVIVPLAALSLWFFQGTGWWLVFKRTLPMTIAVLVYLLIRVTVIQSSDAVEHLPELLNDPFMQWQNGAWLPLSTGDKYGTILRTLGLYLYQVILPFELSHDYYPQAIPVTGLWQWQSLVSLLIYLALAIYALLGLFKRQLPAFAITVYGVSLALFSNVFFTIGTLMAERFLYIPSLGICLLLAWSSRQLMNRISPIKTLRVMLKSSGWMVLVIAVWLTINRSQDWYNNLTLFEADIVKSVNSAKLNNALGGELIKTSQGPDIKNTEQEYQRLNRAFIYLDRAISLHPTYAMPYMLKGNALHYLGKHEAALEAYDHALSLNPDFTTAIDNRSRITAYLRQLGFDKQQQAQEQRAIIFSQQGQFKKAIQAFTELIETHPSAQYYFFRGVAYGQADDPARALIDFKAAVTLTPADDIENLTRIWQAMKTASLQLGESEQAQRYQQNIDSISSPRENNAIN